jgi:hypothetical protein
MGKAAFSGVDRLTGGSLLSTMTGRYYGRSGKDTLTGYFVRDASGELQKRGQEMGPIEPHYKVGDLLHKSQSDGTQARVLDVLTGESAKALGCGVAYIIEEIPGSPKVQ